MGDKNKKQKTFNGTNLCDKKKNYLKVFLMKAINGSLKNSLETYRADEA